MAKISKIFNVSGHQKRNGKLMMLLLILLAICVIGQAAKAETSIYVFGSDQSTVFRSGGIAGLQKTFSIAGWFQLTVDLDTGIALFEKVDANMIDKTGSVYGQSLDEIFNMTGLAGTIIDDTTIEFEGKTADGTESDVSLNLTIREDSVHLTGETTPPPNSADMFFYDIDAVAIKKYAGGIGEPNDPYQIYTAEQMNAIGAEQNDWDKHFKLMADMDLTGIDTKPIGRGTADNVIPFEGSFDGNGKTIANLRRSKGKAGLFEYVDGVNAEIRDIILANPNVHGNMVGSLVGRLGRGTVKDCTVVGGYVSGIYGNSVFSNVGGLIGIVDKGGIMKNCLSSASVTGKNNVGGLIGSCSGTILIVNCGATGTVQGISKVGGLVGYSEGDTMIMNCGATGDVHATDFSAGGLVGKCWRETLIAGSFAAGDVDVTFGAAGGLVGGMDYSRIECCYATGNVSGGNRIGGLLGESSFNYIIDSYASGQVSGTGKDVGGFSGYGGNYDYDCFWDTETSLAPAGGYEGTGLPTMQMQDPNTFISAGWDFVGESANGPSDIWIMPEGGGYPILSWQVSPLSPLPSFSGGTGEQNDPFIISIPQELNSIGHNPRLMSAHFKIASDIDLTGLDFFVIGSQCYPFMGVFDGGEHEISNFFHEANRKCHQYVGLFRYVRGTKAEIRNLVLAGSRVLNHVDLSGVQEDYVGSLAGLLHEGTVLNCHIESGEVSVQTSEYVGGLIGYNKLGIIEKCTSTANVTRSAVIGNTHAGGLLGYNVGIVTDCHSYDSFIDGYSSVGGLVGSNWGFVTNCSASGHISGCQQIGGLVGWNLSAITASCSYCNIEGSLSVGGLAGENIGRISNCYTRGTVSGGEYVGGLVGSNTYRPIITGSITTSYSTAQVSGNAVVHGFAFCSGGATVSDDCFWDTQTSGQVTSDCGTGKTTDEMQTASTFLDAGWDFVGETENGTEDIWWILEGQDYPRLWWETE